MTAAESTGEAVDTPAVARTRRSSGVGQDTVDRVLEALRSDGPSSQAALARRTRRSPATINNVVKRLREDGIAEIRPLNGRESVVALVSRTGAIAALQVNTMGMRASLFDFAAHSRHDSALTIDPSRHPEGGSPALAVDLVRSVCDSAGIAVDDLGGVAVAMQGPIARTSGAVTSWARLQLPEWVDVPIAEHLTTELGVPVCADNDANMAALAEWTWGAGRGSSDFLYVMCSTGVGGGLILDGRVHRGSDGLAGEIGHMVLDQNGPVCFCGSRGCLTTFTSERAILGALEEAAGSPKTSLREVIESARAGDPACRRVLNEAGRSLGRAFATTCKLVAPDVIAVGGLLGAAGPLVFDGLNSSVEINSLRAVSPSVRFCPAEIGGDATLFGGVAAVLTLLGQGVSALPDWTKRTDRAASFRN